MAGYLKRDDGTLMPVGFHLRVRDGCPAGCTNGEPPYCHCQTCGETKCALSEHGYCKKCLELETTEGV